MFCFQCVCRMFSLSIVCIIVICPRSTKPVPISFLRAHCALFQRQNRTAAAVIYSEDRGKCFVCQIRAERGKRGRQRRVVRRRLGGRLRWILQNAQMQDKVHICRHLSYPRCTSLYTRTSTLSPHNKPVITSWYCVRLSHVSSELKQRPIHFCHVQK